MQPVSASGLTIFNPKSILEGRCVAIIDKLATSQKGDSDSDNFAGKRQKE